jgi:thermolabile hemolysin
MFAVARCLRNFVLAIAAFGLVAKLAAAGPFSQLVIFGDSLSDIGNISQASFGIYPGPYYFNARFSNGPVYAEALSTGLGLGTMVRSTAGGNDFAYGGAQTSGTGGLDGLFIKDVDEQVDQFLSSRPVDPNALFVVFSGANDLINGQNNVSIPVGTLATQIGRLVAAGAKQFLVPNLPLLGDTPRFNTNATTAAQYNSLTTQFNVSLTTAIDDLRTTNAALTFYRLDVAALFEQAILDPALFGLTDVSHAAAPGLEPGTTSYNTNQIAAMPNEYLFWDDLHPTTAVHSILAQRALAMLTLPGDYNHNKVVDAADYTVWRDALGKSGSGLAGDGDGSGLVDHADFNIWKTHFGQTAGSGPGASANAAVPEPATSVLLMFAAASLCVCRAVAAKESC